jgi:hypothetical protein
LKIFTQTLAGLKKSCTFATHLRNKPTTKAKRLIKNAQMAELVDALVKHQWIHFHAGSIPALGTEVEKLD